MPLPQGDDGGNCFCIRGTKAIGLSLMEVALPIMSAPPPGRHHACNAKTVTSVTGTEPGTNPEPPFSKPPGAGAPQAPL